MTRSRRRKLQQARAAICARTAFTRTPLAMAMLVAMPPAFAQDPDVGVLEQVVVTAQKREELLQDVPLSIQVIGGAQLEQLNIKNLDGYVKFLPSVSYQSLGPGYARIFMRGVYSGDNGNHSGPLPSVGMYLDEQPVTTIQGPIDVHLYDIARVEALPGPQGTLYGASSQAGTIRIITNKPDPGEFKAGYDLSFNSVTSGDVGYVVEGFANIPLSDNAAIRLVGWYEEAAGYIDNVAGTRSYAASGTCIANTNPPPPGCAAGPNLAKDNYNDVETYGARAALKVDLNESWSITPSVMGQEAKSNGIFAFDPQVGDLQLTHFFPEDAKDSWWQAALTVAGKVGNFDLVYAGAYMKRDFDSQSDYSDYSLHYVEYLGYDVYFYDNSGTLIDPSQYIQGKDGYSMQSHELRISSPKEGRWGFVAGLFYQEQTHDIEQRYLVNNFADSAEVTGWPDTLWLTEQVRKNTDSALFGEVSFDITDKLTVTGGIRFFDSKNSLSGFFGFGLNNSYGSSTGEPSCFPNSGPGVNGGPCTNLDKDVDESGNTGKLNVTYRFTDDALMYATWSEGFRPGGVNRNGAFPPYESDYLTNYEIGWKTSWAGNRVRFNGALFYEKWDDFQFGFLGENGLTNITNAGGAEIYGIETYLDWAVSSNLLISAGMMWLSPELSQDFCQRLTDDDDIPITVQECEVRFPEDFAPEGSELPTTPKFKVNLVARYTWNVGSFDANVQGAFVYQDDAPAELLPADQAIVGIQDSYGIADFSAGLGNQKFQVELFVTNAFDERAQLYKYSECDTTYCGVQSYTGTNVPRMWGIRFGQQF